MTNKLRCPFCGEELFVGDAFIDIQYANCRNPGCKQHGVVMPVEIWQALIQSLKDRKELAIKLAQTNQALEQSEKCCSAWEKQALDYKAETIALSGKLEIATKALKDMMESGGDGYHIARKALEQITHDNSEKANSQEHKE